MTPQPAKKITDPIYATMELEYVYGINDGKLAFIPLSTLFASLTALDFSALAIDSGNLTVHGTLTVQSGAGAKLLQTGTDGTNLAVHTTVPASSVFSSATFYMDESGGASSPIIKVKGVSSNGTVVTTAVGAAVSIDGAAINPLSTGLTAPGAGQFAGIVTVGTGNQLRIADSGSPTTIYYNIQRNSSDGRLEIKGSQVTFNGVRLLTQGGTVKLEFDGTNGYVGVGGESTVVNSQQCALAVNGVFGATGNSQLQGTCDVGGNFSTFGAHNIFYNSDLTAGYGTSGTFYFDGLGKVFAGNSSAALNQAFYPGGASFNARAEAGNAKMRIVTVGDGSVQGFLAFDRTRGTFASPTALQSGDIFGGMVGVGHNGDAVTLAHGPQFIMSTTENWDATHLGSSLEFFTVVTGTNSQVSTMLLKDGSVALSTRNSTPGTTAGSSVTFYLDESGGAGSPTLKVKAVSSNGTVKTGSVTLS